MSPATSAPLGIPVPPNGHIPPSRLVSGSLAKPAEIGLAKQTWIRLSCLVKLGWAIKSLTHKREIILPLSGRRNHSLCCPQPLPFSQEDEMLPQLHIVAVIKSGGDSGFEATANCDSLFCPLPSGRGDQQSRQILPSGKRQSHLALISCQVEWGQTKLWI